MTYHKYLCDSPPPGEAVLGDWRWLTGPALQLLHVTKAGDAFLISSADGSIHLLDTMASQVEQIAKDESEFQTLLAMPVYQEDWLKTEIVDGQFYLGTQVGKDECLSFKHPPALGGQLDPGNVEPCSILVHFSISGQLHRQIKDLPPGTQITNIKIESSGTPAKRPWWKLW